MSDKPSRTAAGAVDPLAFRRALSKFPTGIAVVTAAAVDGPVGITVNSFASVSLDPPLILWSLACATPGFEGFADAAGFCVNVLAEGQSELAERFATPLADKFSGLDCRPRIDAAPLLASCSAWFECRRWGRYDGGDHLIIVGEVLRFEGSDRRPLVFAAGRYHLLGEESRRGKRARIKVLS